MNPFLRVPGRVISNDGHTIESILQGSQVVWRNKSNDMAASPWPTDRLLDITFDGYTESVDVPKNVIVIADRARCPHEDGPMQRERLSRSSFATPVLDNFDREVPKWNSHWSENCGVRYGRGHLPQTERGEIVGHRGMKLKGGWLQAVVVANLIYLTRCCALVQSEDNMDWAATSFFRVPA